LTKKRGGSNFRGTGFPSIYPNGEPQQNLGFYVPPINQFGSVFSRNSNDMENSHGNSLSNMLKDLISSKPNFDENLFKKENKIYQSQYK
jgi:hypothetical protein